MVNAAERDYLMEADRRQASESFEEWHTTARENVVKTMLSISIVVVFLLIVIVLVFPKVLTPMMSVILLANGIKSLWKKETLTALKVRVTPIQFAVEIAMVLINPFSSIKNTEDLINKTLIKIERRLIISAIKDVHKTRKECDKKFLNEMTHVVDPYWAGEGLSISKLNKEAVCCRILTEEPLTKVSSNKSCFKLSTLVRNALIKCEMDKWTNADVSDAMHAKSLHKRVAGEKIEVDLTASKSFLEGLFGSVKGLQYDCKPIEYGIKAALSTAGTAGQFSKRSEFEQIWKTPNNSYMVQFWIDIVDRSLHYTLLTSTIPEKLVSYMLYRKREALPKEEDGNVKVTRIMNAPNLVARVVDSAVMTSMNKGIEGERAELMPTIGMNIFVELKMILIHNSTLKALELDISDYDGGQTAEQIMQNCLVRYDTMVSNGEDIRNLLYIRPRYLRHAFRTVRSTFGIEYNIIGTMASGDFTTSDDNSCRSAAFADMNNKAFLEEGVCEQANTKVHGDDNITLMHNVAADIEVIKGIVISNSRKIGWKIKDDALLLNDCLANGKPKFLSHGVTERKFKSACGSKSLVFAVLTRDETRLLAKLSISAETQEMPNRDEKGKLSSKFLSFIMTSLGHPIVMMVSMLGLLHIRSTSISTDGPFVWRGIKAQTIADLTLDNMIKLQLPYDFNEISWKFLELSACDIIIMTALYEEISKLLGNLKKQFNIKPQLEFEFSVEGEWWDLGETIQSLGLIMKHLQKASVVQSPSNSIQWWEDKPMKLEQTEENHKEGPMVYCCENATKINGENKSPYAIKNYCKTCWDERQERMYEFINIKLENYDCQR